MITYSDRVLFLIALLIDIAIARAFLHDTSVLCNIDD
jgi:hypothetical protein